MLSFSSSNIRINLIYQCSLLIAHMSQAFSFSFDLFSSNWFVFFFLFSSIHSIEWMKPPKDWRTFSIIFNRIWHSKHIWFEFQIGCVFGFDLILTLSWPVCISVCHMVNQSCFTNIEGTNDTVVWHSRWKNTNTNPKRNLKERYSHHRFRQF